MGKFWHVAIDRAIGGPPRSLGIDDSLDSLVVSVAVPFVTAIDRVSILSITDSGQQECISEKVAC